MTRPRALTVGELRVAAAPGRLAIHGLGSCVAVFLYDPGARIGGLAHVLLPVPPAQGDSEDRPGRYATTAVDVMVSEAIRLGARRDALLAKVAGGSRMFAFDSANDRLTVGDKNVEAALRALADRRIEVIATDVGGTVGRTVVADLLDGSLTIKTVRGTPRVV